MRGPWQRRFIATAGGVSACLAASVAVSAPAGGYALPGDLRGAILGGHAHGATASLAHETAGSVTVGKVAPQTLSCNPPEQVQTSEDPLGQSSTLNLVGELSIPLPGNGETVLRTGAVRNSGYAVPRTEVADAYEESRIAAVSLLAGRIRATAVISKAHTTLVANGTATPTQNHHTTVDSFPDEPGNVDGSTGSVLLDAFIDLDGDGVAEISGDRSFAPNETYVLEGVGRVVFNEQVLVYGKQGIAVNAVHVVVGDLPETPEPESFFGFSGDVVVAHAETRVSPSPGRLSGYAYSTRGTARPVLDVGKLALLGMPCRGTGRDTSGDLVEKTRTQQTLTLAAPADSGYQQVLHEDAARSGVAGVIEPDQVVSRTRNRIEGLRLFVSDGVPVLAADVVETVAQVAGATGTGLRGSGEGSTTLNLRIDPDGPGPEPAQAFGPDVPPNTEVPVPGLGVIRLNEWRCSTAPGPTTTLCSAPFSSLDPMGTPDPGDDVDTHYAQITTIGVHVTITAEHGVAGLPQGAELFLAVAHADAAF